MECSEEVGSLNTNFYYLSKVFLTIIFWLFLLSAVVNCGYALYFYSRVLWLPANNIVLPNTGLPPVSVIICAKNEAENLSRYLPFVMKQQYHNEAGVPLFEVIVVNDASEDFTRHVLEKFSNLYVNLVVVHNTRVDPNHTGKKIALKNGVAASKHGLLLFTDADCRPSGEYWLAQMVAPLYGEKEIVAGYSGYYKQAGLLNAFTRWETIHSFLQYSTYIMAGLPYMAVGRNLACKKEIFLSVQDTQTWNVIPYGDDDLLVSIAGNKKNTAVVGNVDAFTYSESKQTLKEYIAQKQRHVSTAKYYKTPIKLLLGCYSFSHAAVWLFLFILLFSPYWHVILAVMAIRCCVYWLLWFIVMRKTNEKLHFYFFPFFDFTWMVYNFAFSPYVFSKNKQNWK